MAFCPMCGRAVANEHRFCAQCGARLALEAGQGTPAALVPSDQALVRAPSSARAWRPAVVDGTITESAPIGVRDPLGSVRTDEEDGRGRRLASAIAMLVLVLASAIFGYRFFARRTAPQGPAVETSDHVVGSAQPAAPGSRGAGTAGTGPPAAAGAAEVWTIVSSATRDTTRADAALGAPDGQTAVIAPGGSLALALALAEDAPFFNGAGADVRVDGPPGDPSPYAIFARATSADPWLRFDANRRGFPKGFALHDFGHHGLQQARQIMIRNDGRVNLYVDAVTPLHLEPEAHGPGDDHGRGARRR